MIGIIPAAGEATRMMGIPKMLLPIPGSTLIDTLIQRMQAAGVSPEIISSHGLVADLIRHHTNIVPLEVSTRTMSETVLCWASHWRLGFSIPRPLPSVLFGMPDTYFDDDQAFVKLAAALDDDADVAVGLFHTRHEQRPKLGLCDFDPKTQRVIQVVDKPKTRFLTWAWGVLAWKPVFWEHIQAEDPHVGYGLPRAIDAGLDVRAVRMDGGYWDCGTPDEYFDCIDHLRSKNYEAGRNLTTAGPANPD